METDPTRTFIALSRVDTEPSIDRHKIKGAVVMCDQAHEVFVGKKPDEAEEDNADFGSPNKRRKTAKNDSGARTSKNKRMKSARVS